MKRRAARGWKIAVLMVLCVLCLLATASAAKVTKVKCDTKYGNGQEYAIIRGKDSKGKTVWKYKSAKYAAAQCSAVGMKTKGSYVYVLEGRKYIRLSKQTGKVLVKKTVLPSNWRWGSPFMAVDSAGNLYATCCLDSPIYCISKAGKVKWKKTLKNGYFWPSKMKLSGSSLTVSFEPPEGACYAVLNTKTGKVKKYSKG